LWKKNVLALDFKSIISEGNVPIYDSLFFGGLNTLRGISVQTYSGSNYIVFTSEYRIPLEKRTGTALYLFSDFGSITNRKEDFSLKNFKSDYGVGLFWVLMEESNFRIDLSLSPKIKLILDIGWKF
jgi:outer membrane protein assembly factor BamA